MEWKNVMLKRSWRKWYKNECEFVRVCEQIREMCSWGRGVT